MEQKSVVLLEDKVVIYQRERSSVWQARVKLADGKWHRQSTREHKEADAKKKALEAYYDARQNLKKDKPQTSRRFSNVAKMAIEQMEKELNNGRGKVVYTHYIAAINNYLIPYFGKMKMDNIDWHEDINGDKYLQITVDGKTGQRSLIARHNVVTYLNRLKNRFDALKDMTLDEIIKKRIDEYVFRLADGTRTENLNQSFEQFLNDTDLLYGTTSDKKRTLYSLRHFYATYQLIKNTSMHKLAVQMGTSIQMLEKHYSKLTPQLMAKEFAGERYRR